LIDKALVLTFIFALITIISCFWIYDNYVENSYIDQKQMVSSYIQHGNYTYSAPVTKINPIYPKGSILEMGKPVYFLAVSPVLNASFEYSLNSTGPVDLGIDVQSMVVATSKEEGSEENSRIIWRKEFPVGDVDIVNIKGGEVFTHHFSIDVPELQSKITDVQNKLQYFPNMTLEIVTRVEYKGEINGKEVSNSTDFAIPLIISSSYYQMPQVLNFSEPNNEYKKYRVKNDFPLSDIKLPLFIFLLSTIMMGMMLSCRRINKVNSDYIKKLENESNDLQFKEFISKGKIPKNTNSLLKIEIFSLQDLVDIAVDINEKVIYDSEIGKYFIVHNNLLYLFTNDSVQRRVN